MIDNRLWTDCAGEKPCKYYCGGTAKFQAGCLLMIKCTHGDKYEPRKVRCKACKGSGVSGHGVCDACGGEGIDLT